MSTPEPSASNSGTPQESLKTLEAFLMDCPPQTMWELDPRPYLEPKNYPKSYELRLPVIQLPCKECDGLMNFSPTEYYGTIQEDKFDNSFIKYVCRNCGSALKTFAVFFRLHEGSEKLTAINTENSHRSVLRYLLAYSDYSKEMLIC